MSYRYMRIMVMFDLPTITVTDRREYTHFRKYLIKSGFLVIQESIYCRIVPNQVMADLVIENIRKNKPANGLVQVLRVTEKQYSKMEFIVGSLSSDVLCTDERLVIL